MQSAAQGSGLNKPQAVSVLLSSQSSGWLEVLHNDGFNKNMYVKMQQNAKQRFKCQEEERPGKDDVWS